MKSHPRKRWAIPILIALIVVCAGSLTWRAVTSVRFIPASDAQIAAIVGDDLKTVAAPTSALLVSRRQIDDIADSVEPDFDRGEPVGANLPVVVDRIRASAQITDRFEKMVKGKTIRQEVENDENDYRPSSLQRMAQLYRVQMVVEAIYDPARCFKAACGAADYCAILDRSELFLTTERLDGQTVTIQQSLLRGIEEAVATGVMSPRQVREVYERIDPAPQDDPALAAEIRRMFAGEFVPQVVQVQQKKDPDLLFQIVFQGSAPMRDLAAGEFDVPNTLAEAAEVARVAIANTAVPWSRRNTKPADRLAKEIATLPQPPDVKKTDGWFARAWEELKFKAKMRSIPNSLGLTILRLVKLSEDDQRKSFERRTMQEAQRLSILLQLFRQLHRGSLPAALDELASVDVLKAMPRDLFSGMPFRYSRERRLFWSVGPNGVDDGGKAGLDTTWSTP